MQVDGGGGEGGEVGGEEGGPGLEVGEEEALLCEGGRGRGLVGDEVAEGVGAHDVVV